MKRENPLLIYKNWFIELGLSLADQIAQAMFQTLTPHQGLHNHVSNPGPSENLGVAAINMLELLDHQLALRPGKISPQFSQALFAATRSVLKAEEQPESTLLEEYREQYLKNLVSGNQQEADYFEELVQQTSLDLDYLDTWNKLKASGFNKSAISNQGR